MPLHTKFFSETRATDLQCIFHALGELEMVVTLGMAVPTTAVELHIIIIYPNANAPPSDTRTRRISEGGASRESLF